MKHLLFVTAGALALTSCAITSGHRSGPSGQPVYYIDGMTAGVAYKKAQELCPGGYTLLGDPRQTSILDYEMTIECKPGYPTVSAYGATPSGGTAPQPTPLAAAAAPARYYSILFTQIKPGVTTPAEMEALFGPPHSSMAMSAQMQMIAYMWINESQVFGAIFENGTFKRLQALSGIDLSIAERQRLGL